MLAKVIPEVSPGTGRLAAVLQVFHVLILVMDSPKSETIVRHIHTRMLPRSPFPICFFLAWVRDGKNSTLIHCRLSAGYKGIRLLFFPSLWEEMRPGNEAWE